MRHTAAEMEGVLPFWGKTDTHYGVSALTTGFGFRSLCKAGPPLTLSHYRRLVMIACDMCDT